MRHMRSTSKKMGEVLLSVLLVALICVPLPATRAFAEDADGDAATPQSLNEQNGGEDNASGADDAYADGTGEIGGNGVAGGQVDADTSDIADGTGTAGEPVDNSIDDEVNGNGSATGEQGARASRSRALALATEAPATAQAAAAATESASAQDMADAFKASDGNKVSVSTASELESALDAVNAILPAGTTYTIVLAGDIALAGTVSVDAGRSVTLSGAGHEISLANSAAIDALGALSLTGPLTITESPDHTGSLLVVTGGSLRMGSGVALIGNGAAGTAEGGAVYLSNKADFDMAGGAITGFQAIRGGAVFLADARPNTVSTFTMSGDATISGNRASEVGGGVYVGTRDTFAMQGADARIVGNSADAAGGVMNYGRSTLDAVYNNTTRNGAADIFNFAGAYLTLSPTSPDWVLARTGTNVTGWYVDNYHITDDDGNQGDGMHRWDPARDDAVEYVPGAGATREELHLIAGAPLPVHRVDVLWENQDGSVLYEMDGVAEADVPAADEYTALSGKGEPTEPDTPDGYAHEFTGWIATHPTDDEIVYIADYRLVATADATSHDVKVRYVDEDGNELAGEYVARYADGEHYTAPVPEIDGYVPDRDSVEGVMAGSDVEETVTYHKADADTGEQPRANSDGGGDDGAGDNGNADEEQVDVIEVEETEETESGNNEAGVLQQTGDEMGAVIAGLIAAALVSGVVIVAAARKGEEDD